MPQLRGDSRLNTQENDDKPVDTSNRISNYLAPRKNDILLQKRGSRFLNASQDRFSEHDMLQNQQKLLHQSIDFNHKQEMSTKLNNSVEFSTHFHSKDQSNLKRGQTTAAFNDIFESKLTESKFKRTGFSGRRDSNNTKNHINHSVDYESRESYNRNRMPPVSNQNSQRKINILNSSGLPSVLDKSGFGQDKSL